MFLCWHEDTSLFLLLSVERSSWQIVLNFSSRQRLYCLLVVLFGLALDMYINISEVMEICNNSGSALCKIGLMLMMMIALWKIIQSKIIILSLNMESNNYCYVEFWRQLSIFKLRIKYTHAYIYIYIYLLVYIYIILVNFCVWCQMHKNTIKLLLAHITPTHNQEILFSWIVINVCIYFIWLKNICSWSFSTVSERFLHKLMCQYNK